MVIEKLKIVYKILIGPYFLFILYMLFFGFGRTQMEDHLIRIAPIYSTYSYVGWMLNEHKYGMLMVNILGNLMVFIPFGFLGWIVEKYQNYNILALDFLVAIVLVEFTQYITRLGVFDVDDILFNFISVSLGFRLKKIFEKYL